MKLHLGCGDRVIHLPGWFNVDLRPPAKPGAAFALCVVGSLPVADGAIDLVYASHVLEHIRRPDTAAVLAEWRRVLRPGGTLRIAVPDLEVAFRTYLEGQPDAGIAQGDLDHQLGQLYGRQDFFWNTHFQGFDFRRLSRVLTEAGFVDVRRYDWRATEHADVDDGSQHYWPHMDKVRGVLRSLNVEATKPLDDAGTAREDPHP